MTPRGKKRGFWQRRERTFFQPSNKVEDMREVGVRNFMRPSPEGRGVNGHLSKKKKGVGGSKRGHEHSLLIEEDEGGP